MEDLDRFHGQDRKGGSVKNKDVFNAILSRILQQKCFINSCKTWHDPLREGLLDQKVPKYRHCLNGGGLTLACIFVKDLSTCTEGPQR